MITITLVIQLFCFRQSTSEINIFQNSFINGDTLNVSMTIKSTDTINYPSYCIMFDSEFDFYPMFLCFEIEECKNGNYIKLIDPGYGINFPHIISDTVKSDFFECSSIFISYKFNKGAKYRIRYYVHLERFNPRLSMKVTEWYDLKFEKP